MIQSDTTAILKAIADWEGVALRAENFAPAAQDVGLVCMADVDQRFASAPGVRTTGQVYGGVRWQRLSEAYLRSNPRRIGGQQLRDTGELAQSFQIGRSGNIAAGSRDTITFGSRLPKARWNHRRRKIVVVHPPLVRQVSRVLVLYLRGKL
jgi:hypothetical protein